MTGAEVLLICLATGASAGLAGFLAECFVCTSAMWRQLEEAAGRPLELDEALTIIRITRGRWEGKPE